MLNFNRLKPRDRTWGRRGTIYVLVLISSSIVATIGLASLQLLRLQSRVATDGNDLIEARLYARAAIELGMLKVRTDSNWRNNLGNGMWVTDQAIGDGKFSVKAVDPIDNDIKNGVNHPIILTGTGSKGIASFSTSVRLEVGLPTGSCLEVSMTSGGDTTVSGATLTSDQTTCANATFTGSSGATINSNVQAWSVKGSTYTKTKVTKMAAKDLPDPLTVLDYYLARGTVISYTALQQWTQPQMIINTTFEADLSSWYAINTCTLQKSSTRRVQGIYSMLVTSRGSNSAVAAHDLVPASLALLKSGHQYNLTLPFYCVNNCTAQAKLTITDSTGTTQTFSTPSTFVNNDTWTDLTGTLTPTWSGSVTKATVSIGLNTNNSYYLDSVSLTDVTYPLNDYVVDRKLISPTVNPFGAATNAEGIYVIDCGGQDVVIGDSRIVGTLVLLNPGSNCVVQGSVIWEAAKVNFPALLSDGSIDINCSAAGLSEAYIGTNLNPVGTPYPFLGGTANSTATDSYPSKINGIVYSGNDLTFNGAPTISGVVVAQDKIRVNATSLNLQFGNSYLSNAPPGFDLGQTIMKPIPGTWKQVVP